MKDLSTQRLVPVEGHLAIQAGHLAHPRVFPKGLAVSPVVIRSGVRQRVVRLAALPVGIHLEDFPVDILLEAFLEVIPSAAASLVEAVLVASMVAVFPVVAEVPTVVAAVDK